MIPGPFDHALLNEKGREKSARCRVEFLRLWEFLEKQCCGSSGGREMALMKTNLQQAAFWAQKAISLSGENREERVDDPSPSAPLTEAKR